MSVNVPAAIIGMLGEDSVAIAEAGSVTVYGQSLPAITGEMDDEWAALMPRRMVLVMDGGGLPNVTKNSLAYPRFDVRCYGAEPGGRYDSRELSDRIDECIFGAHDRVRGIVSITQAAGPTPGREPDTEWAFTLRTYDVLAGG